MYNGENPPTVCTEGGLFSRNTLKGTNTSAQTPLKTFPLGYLEEEDELLPESRKVAETYNEVDSSKLADFENGNDSAIEGLMEEKLHNLNMGEFHFAFWSYTDTHPISKEEASTIVKLSETYSDVITPPLQHSLLRAIIYEDEEDYEVDEDDEALSDHPEAEITPLLLYRIGVERFLEAAEDSKKAVMAPIPFLRDDYDAMRNFLVTYEQSRADIDMLCFNLHRRKPTSPANEDSLLRLIGFMKAWDIFDGSLKYAINVRHSYHTEGNLRTAEDLALAAMGFDFIGENHWKPQSTRGGNWETSYDLFDVQDMAYQRSSPSRRSLECVWPGETGFDIGEFADAENYFENRRLQKLFNAEQLELALGKLRSSVDSGTSESFVQEHQGLKLMESSLNSAADAYLNPDSQSTFGQF